MSNADLSDVFTRYPDSGACAAVAAHRIADVAVAGTVADEPTFFVGRRTHALHETFDIVTPHGLKLRVVDNVALAPEIPVHAGDNIVVAGQLIPARAGAIVHDTHHWPGPGWHRGGWIEWNGRRYA
ncbi:MAG TPA: DUF3465 domain-containing protein [Candidatus Eremiobacteraceae bacterium]